MKPEVAMPVSKKPRHKRKHKEPAKPLSLPDRSMLEQLLAGFSAGVGDDPISQAQEIMYDAWEQTDPIGRIALVRRALEISPSCADAYVMLAQETAKSDEEARDLFAQGVEAGERAGAAGVRGICGSFLGF